MSVIFSFLFPIFLYISFVNTRACFFSQFSINIQQVWIVKFTHYLRPCPNQSKPPNRRPRLPLLAALSLETTDPRRKTTASDSLHRSSDKVDRRCRLPLPPYTSSTSAETFSSTASIATMSGTLASTFLSLSRFQRFVHRFFLQVLRAFRS